MCKKKELNIRLMENKNIDPFAQYYISCEPDKAQKAHAWKTAIGLQKVDNLHVSDYLISLAVENIEGRMSIAEVNCKIEEYYSKTTHSRVKQDIEQHIEKEKDLLTLLNENKVTAKIKNNIISLHKAFGIEKIFGRSDIVGVLSLTEKPASTLIKKMLELGMIENVRGLGKGKYRFVRC
ncbi:antitoxin VbhA family protein [Anaerovibrio sp.]|uniref:antitoxin VbhA family protein n=1 Tax=Anaerovibrio sp. TaxID=1872532 RepID=UPI0025C65B4A|nr:antitoxin VbhA family protein [Anaerovibrio sp.]MBR2143365.1 antitoxin VbhA family protein [Anaerovibrio sp.]